MNSPAGTGIIAILLFVYPGLEYFMSKSADVSRKPEDAYPTGAPGPCSTFLVEFRVVHLFLLVLYNGDWSSRNII